MVQISQVIKGIAMSCTALYMFSFVLPTFAQDLPGQADPFAQGSSSSNSNPSTFSGGIDAVKNLAGTNKLAPAQSTKEILQTITKWLLSLVATIAVISLLYGGFLYISSQGEESQVEKAKHVILYSVIGIIIIGVSAIIVNVVINLATT